MFNESATSEQAMQAPIEYARSQPTVGGAWIDQSTNPVFDENHESTTNDSATFSSTNEVQGQVHIGVAVDDGL